MEAIDIKDKLMMNIALNVNHTLVNGYVILLFSEKFQYYLNNIEK